jgi:hypothetical protein
MFAILGKEKPDIENVRDLNLAVVRGIMYYAYMNYRYIKQYNLHLIDDKQLYYLVPGGNKYRNMTLQV